MELIYRSRHIHSLPELNLETDCWVPRAEVSWYQEGTEFHHLLTDQLAISRLSTKLKSMQ